MTNPDKLVIELYIRKGIKWAELRKKESTLYERGWLDRFLQLVPKTGSILDLGCGCGVPIAQYFIEQEYQVTGVDASPYLLEMAQAAFPLQRWILSDMRGLQLDDKFNGIISWDSFFHLNHEDQRAMFKIFAQHAAERAALMFTSGPSHGEVLGELEGEPLYHASLDPAEYRALFHHAGFKVRSEE